MTCAGKHYCGIYRDKKFCRNTEKVNYKGPCNCSHAKYKCEIGHCSFLYDVTPARKGGPDIYTKCSQAEALNLKIYKEFD